MFKKTILWTFYLFFVGGLIWAAVNRSSAALGETQQNTQNHGSESSQDVSILAGNATAVVTTTIPVATENSDIAETHDTNEHSWMILQAKITQLNQRDIVIRLEDGNSLTIKPRPWRFALDQGFKGKIGDTLLVTGFYENDKFEIVHFRNLDNATVAQIRDEEGHPLWNSGGGGGD